jgi:hypothetical protein
VKNKKDIIISLLNKHFEEAMFCGRSWDAWHVGTMAEDDFEYIEAEHFEKFADELILLLNLPDKETPQKII